MKKTQNLSQNDIHPYHTFPAFIILACLTFFSGLSFGSNGVGDGNDDYTKPCETTSMIEVEVCGPFPTSQIGEEMYVSIDFFFTYNYLYEPEGASPLNPMYMEVSFADGANNLLDLHTTPPKPSTQDILANKTLLLSAPFVENKEKANSHQFHIAFHFKARHLDLSLGTPQIHFNFFDMYEKEVTIQAKGIPVEEVKERQTGDIIVYPDGSYYHYEKNIETILNLSACSFPEEKNTSRFLPHTISSSSLPAQLTPNPIDEDTELAYQLDDLSMVHMTLYDVSGKIIPFPIVQEFKGVGIHRRMLSLAYLKPGLYFLHLQTKRSLNSLKFIKN